MEDLPIMQRSIILLSLTLLAAGCHDNAGQAASNGSPPQAAAPTPPPALLARLDPINQATPQPAAAPQPQGREDAPPSPFLIRAEVLLARAHFSPGVVDGLDGTNVKHAIAAYQSAHSLPTSGDVDSATWAALMAEAGADKPVAQSYTITAADAAGPFAPDVGEDFVKLAALPNGPGFTNVVEALAERFHMSQALLTALNPGATMAAGQQIIVVDANPPAFTKGQVARIDVAKGDASVRAYDDGDKLIAFYPATVGSTDRPSPSGTHKVVGVANDPTYTYDPAKLKWGPRSAGKLVVKPGPNNPVGAVWIDLNAPSYGLHGTANPDTIGKTASHGCVRLTNWDARALADGVKPGVTVRFMGQRGG